MGPDIGLGRQRLQGNYYKYIQIINVNYVQMIKRKFENI